MEGGWCVRPNPLVSVSQIDTENDTRFHGDCFCDWYDHSLVEGDPTSQNGLERIVG